jgi:hypothetical protein
MMVSLDMLYQNGLSRLMEALPVEQVAKGDRIA